MNASNGMKSLTLVLALMCLVAAGCRKKPVGLTPLPGSRAGQVANSDMQPGGILPPDSGTGSGVNGGPGAGASGIPIGQGHQGWTEDRETFKADVVYFDYDSSSIKAGEKSKIESVSSFLKQNSAAAVRVEGNCDERGTEEYNRALGERRALAVREYLVREGVAADRVDTISYGEDKPADSGHSEAAWKKNRRDEFVVLTAPK